MYFFHCKDLVTVPHIHVHNLIGQNNTEYYFFNLALTVIYFVVGLQQRCLFPMLIVQRISLFTIRTTGRQLTL